MYNRRRQENQLASRVAELVDRGLSVEAANRQLQELWNLFEALL